MKDRYLQQEESYYRLKTEYEKHGSLVIAYDFDNTVFDFHNTGDTHPLMIELLQDLKSIGCYLICFTAKEVLTVRTETKGDTVYTTFIRELYSPIKIGEILNRYIMELLVKLPQPTKVKDIPSLAGKFVFDVETVATDPNVKVEWITLTLLDIPTTNTNENRGTA